MNKESVLKKISILKEYSVAADVATGILFEPVLMAIEKYFNSDNAAMVQALEDVAKYMYNDIYRRTTTYQFEFDMGLSTNYPQGYNDIEQCFYQFAELLTVTDQQFFNAFVYGLPPNDPMATEQIPLSNPYLDRWETEITAAIDGDLKNIQALAEWCKNSGGKSDLICLFENRGVVTKQLSVKDIATIIYRDKKLLDVARARALPVYIPSYLK